MNASIRSFVASDDEDKSKKQNLSDQSIDRKYEATTKEFYNGSRPKSGKKYNVLVRTALRRK